MKGINTTVKTPTPIVLTGLFFALFLSLDGCRRYTPPGPNTHTAKVEDASYVLLRWDEGLSVMMWFDFAGVVFTSGHGSTRDPIYMASGYKEAIDGRRVEWQLKTEDGITATCKINDTTYDLSKGTLFLISTPRDQVNIRQIGRDLSGVSPTVDSCTEFGKNDPDVSVFIKRVSELE
ncbi:MAG: hypothetical protein JSU94_06290 [Phycisphaerales bacterium]|nr:MAG: hypothetical protein JSU94_06290 [Phycisphaerales bacterium]